MLKRHSTIVFWRCCRRFAGRHSLPSGRQRPEAREELIQEVVANCYSRLGPAGAPGQRVGGIPHTAGSICDPSGPRWAAGRRPAEVDRIYCLPSASKLHGFTVERFDQKDPQTGVWNEQLVEDRRAGPAEIAAARLDLAAWSRTLSKRNRRIARALSMGETTSVVARAIWAERRPGQPTASVAARALGAVSGRWAVGRMRGISEPMGDDRRSQPSRRRNPAQAGFASLWQTCLPNNRFQNRINV